MTRRALCTLFGMALGAALAVGVAAGVKGVLLRGLEPVALWTVTIGLVAVYGAFGYLGAGAKPKTEFIIWMLTGPGIATALAMAAGFILLIVALIWPFVFSVWLKNEWKLRRRMKANGRFATLHDLRPKLTAGMGTLIEETGLKGPFRIWWTEDDLFANGDPLPTDDDYIDILNGDVEHPINLQYLKDYLGVESGRAVLTTISARHATSGKLARQFPLMKRAMLVQPPYSVDA